MLSCIIIEDQIPAQLILKKYIEKTDGIQLNKIFTDVSSVQTYLEKNSVDLVFLDIHLPRTSGIDFLKNFANMPMTILTTAYSEFALESYQYNVIDYLLKPFSYARFSHAIEKAKSLFLTGQSIENDKETIACVYIKSSHNLVKVTIQDILFIKSDGDYTEVVTAEQKYLAADSLKDWITRLDGVFCQVHKSYIVNTQHVVKISHNKIHLTPPHLIPIGRVFKKGFIERFSG